MELCRRRAAHAGERILYRYLVDGDVTGAQALLSYAKLERRARAIGALLQTAGLENERVLLLYPPGLDFITAFFGCLFAGVIAVPAYPPDHRRLERTLPRLRAIARNATASAVLTIGAFERLAAGLAETAPELAALRWLATDELAPGLEAAWRAPEVSASTTAFLQYTSGSTGDPKGVVVSHENLLVNAAAIFERLGFDAEDVIVSWLPAYHDLGLVGAIILSLFGGVSAVLLPPMAFLRRPMRWLEAISHFRGTVSASPSFALDLCSRKVTPEEVATLDLRSWRIAVSGAEPVRAESLERFSDRFAPAGFSHAAHCPTYGLAESTLMVTAERPGVPRVLSVDKEALAGGQIVVAPAGRAVVGCGRAAPGHEVAIVAPETRVVRGDLQIGEIWVRGPSVAQGYWRRPNETEPVFLATLADSGAGPFLRTGDLGFVHDGEVFVTGRLKDVILIGGMNHYPQDLERTVERCHPQIREGSVAAFPFEVRGEERVGVAAEVETWRGTPGEDITAAILQALLADHGLDAALVALLEPGALPKTSSGKLQRCETRAQILGGVPVLHRYDAAHGGSVAVKRGSREILDFLCERFARALGLHPDTIDPSRSVTDYGLGSLLLVETFTELGAWLGRTVDLELAFRATTIEALARSVAAPAHRQPMFRVIQARTPQQHDEIYRLRQQICVEELGYQMAGTSPEEGDEHALLFLARDEDGRPAGTLAINRWSDGPLGAETIASYQLERFTQLVPREAILVGRKLLVAPQHRSGSLFFDLLRAGLVGAHAPGQHFVFLDCSPDLVGFYTRLGCRRYAPSFRRGDGVSVPLCLVLTDHVHLDEIRSPLLGLLRELYADAAEGRDHFARCRDDVATCAADHAPRAG